MESAVLTTVPGTSWFSVNPQWINIPEVEFWVRNHKSQEVTRELGGCVVSVVDEVIYSFTQQTLFSTYYMTGAKLSWGTSDIAQTKAV